jgi:hypothetical protein
MAKTSRKAATKRGNKPKHYDKPLSLYGMSFLNAVDKALATKPQPAKKATKKR